MRTLDSIETFAISGGDYIATIQLQVPNLNARALNHLMINLAVGTIKTADDLIRNINGLQDVQGWSLDEIRVLRIDNVMINT